MKFDKDMLIGDLLAEAPEKAWRFISRSSRKS